MSTFPRKKARCVIALASQAWQSSGGMSATKVEEAQETQTRSGARTGPPWNVILHNDWDNSMPRVVFTLMKVIPSMTVKRAARIMWEAHTKGQAVAKKCHSEGVVILTCGTFGNVLRFLPSLVMSEALLGEGLTVIEGAFAAM